uniref:Uncharacterized protein n=1 Tax=Arundo donax TaxID=35708 RepID=A0A0A9BQ34_ARUDO
MLFLIVLVFDVYSCRTSLKDSGCLGQRARFLSSSGSTLRCSRSDQSRI